MDILFSFAGFDATGGAGVMLDLKVFHALGFYGMALPSGLTIQNTRAVKGRFAPPPEFLLRQYLSLTEDVDFAGIKIGMLGSALNLPLLDRIISEHQTVPIVVDPVFQSSSGAWLIDRGALSDFMDCITGRISLLTPNLAEAARMTGKAIKNPSDMEEASRKIHHLLGVPVLLKGGHLPGIPKDILFDGTNLTVLEKKRLSVKAHGTGCFLSAATLAFLARDMSLAAACRSAGDLIHKSLKQALTLGKGQSLLSIGTDTRLAHKQKL